MPEDAWWPAGEEAWELTDIGQSYVGSQGNSSRLRTVWIKPSSLGAKLAELFPERRKSASALDSKTGFGCSAERQDSMDKSGDGGKTGNGQHCSSEVKGQYNYVGRTESGSYSHEDEDIHLRGGFGHNSSVHVCQSRVPRPCRYMQRCRNPDSCRYCHHETHQDMRQKEL